MWKESTSLVEVVALGSKSKILNLACQIAGRQKTAVFVKENHFFNSRVVQPVGSNNRQKRTDASTPELPGPPELDQSLFPRRVSEANKQREEV